jgi:Tol biopolymer transport system component
MLLNMVKFDKTRKVPPAFKSYTYDLAGRKLAPVSFEGNNKVCSPDGKTFVFTRQKENNKADIYLYDITSSKETVLVSDTFHKSSPGWSNDGRKIVYTKESNGRGRFATLDICVVDIASKNIQQITQSSPHKSYNPVWAPEGNQIVYYFEKGDNRDQIWLTDANGSFHTNLTNDTSTHNYFPSWIDKETIVYTQNPNTIMTMKTDGSNRKKVEGLNSFLVKYDPVSKQAAYVTQQPDSKLMLFDWNKKTTQVLLTPDQLSGLF